MCTPIIKMTITNIYYLMLSYSIFFIYQVTAILYPATACHWYVFQVRAAVAGTPGNSLLLKVLPWYSFNVHIYLVTACRWDVSSIWQLHYTWRQLATKTSSMWQLTWWQLSAEMFCIWQQYQVTAYHSYVFHVTALLHLATVCYWYVFHVTASPCDSLPLSDVSCDTLPGDSLPLRRLPCDSLAREWTAFWPVRLEWQRLGRDPNFGLPTRIE